MSPVLEEAGRFREEISMMVPSGGDAPSLRYARTMQGIPEPRLPPVDVPAHRGRRGRRRFCSLALEVVPMHQGGTAAAQMHALRAPCRPYGGQSRASTPGDANTYRLMFVRADDTNPSC